MIQIDIASLYKLIHTNWQILLKHPKNNTHKIKRNIIFHVFFHFKILSTRVWSSITIFPNSSFVTLTFSNSFFASSISFAMLSKLFIINIPFSSLKSSWNQLKTTPYLQGSLKFSYMCQNEFIILDKNQTEISTYLKTWIQIVFWINEYEFIPSVFFSWILGIH